MDLGSRHAASADPAAPRGEQPVRAGRLTVRGVLEILAEHAPEREAGAAEACAEEDDLRAVLAFVDGEPASGTAR